MAAPKFRGKSTHPSKGLSKRTLRETVKKARAGKDIGKPGKHFAEIEAKAARRYGSKEAGERVAGAAMWKNLHK